MTDAPVLPDIPVRRRRRGRVLQWAIELFFFSLMVLVVLFVGFLVLEIRPVF